MSNTRSTIIREAKINLFCDNLEKLMEELSALYPNDNTLALCVTMYHNFSGFFKEDIVKQFIYILKPFSDKILERDEEFFLTEVHESFSNDQWMLNEINKIRSIWQDPNTTNETKESLWKYMTTFVKIGRSLKLC